VIAQAGSSEPGRRLASRVADMIFTAQSVLSEGQAFYREIKARAVAHGRAPDDVKVMPGLMVITGRTEAEARRLYEELQVLVDDATAMRLLARLTGDLGIFRYPPDGPLPDLPPSNAARARQEHLMAKARREGLSIRQVARYLGTSLGHQLVVGSPPQVADAMQEWLEAEACDGFMLMFPFYPKPLDDFVALVVPELQRRDIHRTAYEGRTLRENLGVPVPANRFAR
jgi:alkanesulfonate monooxygenase SsuD/methylene tetrahydromethanopterin reductase-like flavin-dependent oxidoreductase (luciferase family)